MKNKPPTPRESLTKALLAYCETIGSPAIDVQILSDIPRRWQKFGDCVLLTSGFRLPFWKQFDSDNAFWSAVGRGLRARRIAIASRIESDGFRTPQVSIKLGSEFGSIVRHVEQGILYTWDVTKSMFSQGNGTEKARVARLSCAGETVVDLYAGIGYFTLPYLVKARADHVIACEWNPAAVACLRRNLVENGISPERCQILEGDNRVTCPSGVAHRVNLGLIPSSREGWPVACQALSRTVKNSWLHIHDNVTSGRESVSREVATFNELSSDVTCSKSLCKPEWVDWCTAVRDEILTMLNSTGDGVEWNVSVKHIEHVKSYAPHIDHMVVDLLCEPNS